MAQVRENGATSGAGLLATYAYTDLGQRYTLTRGNGVVSTYSYDVAGRMTGLAHVFPSGYTANNQTLSFTYSPASQILTRGSTVPRRRRQA